MYRKWNDRVEFATTRLNWYDVAELIQVLQMIREYLFKRPSQQLSPYFFIEYYALGYRDVANETQRFPEDRYFICQGVGGWSSHWDFILLLISTLEQPEKIDRRYEHLRTIGQIELTILDVVNETLLFIEQEASIFDRKAFEDRYNLEWISDEEKARKHDKKPPGGPHIRGKPKKHTPEDGLSVSGTKPGPSKPAGSGQQPPSRNKGKERDRGYCEIFSRNLPDNNSKVLQNDNERHPVPYDDSEDLQHSTDTHSTHTVVPDPKQHTYPYKPNPIMPSSKSTPSTESSQHTMEASPISESSLTKRQQSRHNPSSQRQKEHAQSPQQQGNQSPRPSPKRLEQQGNSESKPPMRSDFIEPDSLKHEVRNSYDQEPEEFGMAKGNNTTNIGCAENPIKSRSNSVFVSSFRQVGKPTASKLNSFRSFSSFQKLETNSGVPSASSFCLMQPRSVRGDQYDVPSAKKRTTSATTKPDKIIHNGLWNSNGSHRTHSTSFVDRNSDSQSTIPVPSTDFSAYDEDETGYKRSDSSFEAQGARNKELKPKNEIPLSNSKKTPMRPTDKQAFKHSSILKPETVIKAQELEGRIDNANKNTSVEVPDSRNFLIQDELIDRRGFGCTSQ